jgi:hypothetical protein
VTTTVKAGDHEESYELLLEAPNGDFRQTREYAISGANVVETHSWWSAWVGCLSGAARRHASTLFGHVPAHGRRTLWCVVARCGGCVLVRGVFHVRLQLVVSLGHRML